MTEKIVQQLNLTENQLTVSQLEQLSQLLNWLETRDQETASMREIKESFPHWHEIDTELDFYVKKVLIGRQDRRYHRLLPTVTASRMAEITAQAKKVVANIIETNDMLKTCLVQEPWLLSLAIYQLLQQASAQAFYFLPETGYHFSQLSCQKSEHYLYLDYQFSECDEALTGLAHYFSTSSHNQSVYQIIGDVNPTFFLEMTGKQLELLADKQQPRHNIESVFLKVLVILGYVQGQAGNYQLTNDLTFISKKELKVKEIEMVERLSVLLEEIVGRLAHPEEKELVKTILLNELLVKTCNREVVVFTQQ